MNRNILIGIGATVGVLAIAVLGFVGYASTRPDMIVVERSRVIDASAAQVHPHLADYRNFVEWSPWSDRDPNQTTTFSEPSSGPEAWYSWDGNDDVGAGRMDTTLVEPMRIEQDLTFTRPFESKAQVVYTLSEVDDGTQVTWTMNQPADLMMKTMTIFMDMDAMIGADFDKGLDSLKARVEAEPPMAAADGEAEGDEAGGMAGDSDATDDTDAAMEGEAPMEGDEGEAPMEGDEGEGDSADE